MAVSEARTRDIRASSGLKKKAYGRIPQYIALILVWAGLVTAYILVLEKAVRNHEYLGARGTQARMRSFDVLAVVRTAFAIIHIPVIVSVLASTVPYWTMVRLDDGLEFDTVLTPPLRTIDELDPNYSVTQLFYLADRNWAGLIGWITTCYNSFIVARPSPLWVHLTVVVALAYTGFPLLSVAYITQSTQYWEPEQFHSAATMGGADMDYDETLFFVIENSPWVGSGLFSTPPDLGSLFWFNSSQETSGPYLGLSNTSGWASGNGVLTPGVGVSSNIQLPLAAVQVNAFCTSASYNDTILVPQDSTGPVAELAFDFIEASADDNWPLYYRLACKAICNTTDCLNRSSTLTLWPMSGDSCFTGQALTCGSIGNSSSTQLGATARLQFAVNGPGKWTTVRTCELSILYVRPIVNTLIGEYIQATIEDSPASSLQTPQGLTPAQLVSLSITDPISMFHDGPPSAADGVVPVTDGFTWISWLSGDGAAAISQVNTGGLANGSCFPNPWSVLDAPPDFFPNPYTITPSSDGTYSVTINPLYEQSSFNEDVFVRPLAFIISNPDFFSNQTITGVAFKTDIELVHGKVSPIFAITVLTFPVLWTFILSVVANKRKRWTASLDAFAMFRLGGDWKGNLKHLRLASLSQAQAELDSIPGMVRVDPDEGLVELTYPPTMADIRDMAQSTEKSHTDTNSRGGRLRLSRAGVAGPVQGV